MIRSLLSTSYLRRCRFRFLFPNGGGLSHHISHACAAANNTKWELMKKKWEEIEKILFWWIIWHSVAGLIIYLHNPHSRCAREKTKKDMETQNEFYQSNNSVGFEISKSNWTVGLSFAVCCVLSCWLSTKMNFVCSRVSEMIHRRSEQCDRALEIIIFLISSSSTQFKHTTHTVRSLAADELEISSVKSRWNLTTLFSDEIQFMMDTLLSKYDNWCHQQLTGK